MKYVCPYCEKKFPISYRLKDARNRHYLSPRSIYLQGAAKGNYGRHVEACGKINRQYPATAPIVRGVDTNGKYNEEAE